MYQVGAQKDASVIATCVQACLSAFRDASDNLDKADSTTKDKLLPYNLSDEIGRFRLWCGNIAAHRVGRSSLDYRLREATHIKGRVLELLQNLRDVVNQAIELITGQRSSWEDLSESDSDLSDDLPPVSGEEDGTTELRQLMSNIAEIITFLMRLSITIRNPAPHNQFKESSRIDTSYFEDFDVQHVRGKFPGAEEFLIHRLGKAISRRRQYLRYRDEHHKKLQKDLDVPIHLPVAPVVPDKAPAPALTIRSSQNPESTVASSVPLALKTSTPTLQFDSVDLYEETLSQTSYASSTNDPTKLKPPLLPEQGHDGEPFECPLCYRFTSVKQISAWHKHVYRDLQPYVCVFQDCKAEDHMYESRHDWFQHELQEHRRSWECIDGCNLYFGSQSSFSGHLKEHYPEADGGARLEDLMRSCERQQGLNTEADCPLCHQHILTLAQLRRHLGKHHEELALFAMPSHMKDQETEDDDIDDNSRSLSSMEDSNNTDRSDQFICEHCGERVFGDSKHEALLEHIQDHHSEGMMICKAEGCLKLFPKRNSLMLHKKIHALHVDTHVGKGSMQHLIPIPWRLNRKNCINYYIDDHLMAVDEHILLVADESSWMEIPLSYVTISAHMRLIPLLEGTNRDANDTLGLGAQRWMLVQGENLLAVQQLVYGWLENDLTGRLQMDSNLDAAAMVDEFLDQCRKAHVLFDPPHWFHGNLELMLNTVPMDHSDKGTGHDAGKIARSLLGSQELSLLPTAKKEWVEMLYRLAMETIKGEWHKPKAEPTKDILQHEKRLLIFFTTLFYSTLSRGDFQIPGSEYESIVNLTRLMLRFEARLIHTMVDISVNPVKLHPELSNSMSFSIFVGNLPLDIPQRILQAFLMAIFRSRYPSCFSASIPVDQQSGAVKGFAYIHFGKEDECNNAVKFMAGVACGGKDMTVDFTDTRVELPQDADWGIRNGEFSSLVEYTDETPPPPKTSEVKLIDDNHVILAVMGTRTWGLMIQDVSSGSELVHEGWESVRVKALTPGSKTVSIFTQLPSSRAIPVDECRIETWEEIEAKQIVHELSIWINKARRKLEPQPTLTFQVRTVHSVDSAVKILELSPTSIALKTMDGQAILRKRWKSMAWSSNDGDLKIRHSGHVVHISKFLPYLATENYEAALQIATCFSERIAMARSIMPEIASGSQTSSDSDEDFDLSEAESLGPDDPVFNFNIASEESDTDSNADKILVVNHDRTWEFAWKKCKSSSKAEDMINTHVFNGQPPKAGYVLRDSSQASGQFWIESWTAKVRPGCTIVVEELHDSTTPTTQQAFDTGSTTIAELPSTLHSPKDNPSCSKMWNLKRFRTDGLARVWSDNPVFQWTAKPLAIYVYDSDWVHAFVLTPSDAPLRTIIDRLSGKGVRYNWDNKDRVFRLDERKLKTFSMTLRGKRDAKELVAQIMKAASV